MCAVLGLLALLMIPGAADAQDSRMAEHEQAQASKALTVTPPAEGRLDRLVSGAKRMHLFGRDIEGFYPQVTSVYSGGWMAFGGGYRRHLGDHTLVDLNAAWSVRNFKKVEATATLPPLFAGSTELRLEGEWIDAPSVVFYGPGNDSRAEDETTFAYRPTSIGVAALMRPRHALLVGGGLGYVGIETISTLDGPADAVARLSSASGLGAGPRYLRTRAFLEVDWRTRPGYSGSGGLYRVEAQDYSDRSGSSASYRSLEAEAVQLVPIHGAQWVVAVRGLATVTDDRGEDDVPFYLMPAVGGNNLLRGYSSFRFRGHHRLVLNGEFRWTATRFLDMALFYDAGKVAMDLGELNLRDLKRAYGIGARFHGTSRTVFRLELARNDERAWRLVWATGAAF